jgi:Cu(I)/Ag(I) efflux system membrane fusion protein
MHRITLAILAIGLVAASLAAGYWWGMKEAEGGRRKAEGQTAAETGKSAAAGKKILYYRNPMGLPDISPVPKKDPMGMDYIPVYEG